MTKKSCSIIFTEPHQKLDIQHLDIPPLKEGEILVKNEYTTLCKSDILTFTGKRKEKSPTILGHEIVGRISAFGPNAPNQDVRNKLLKLNDRISWTIYASNPSGKMALEGIPQKAPDLFKYGHEAISSHSTLHGGLSEYTILRAYTTIAKLEEDVPVSVAATINCAVATVAGAYRIAGKVKGKNVLISGAGMLGLVACAMGKSLGANCIFALDIDWDRIELAKKFGADGGLLANNEAAESLNHEAVFDIILEMSGVPQAVEDALPKLGIGGTLVLVGSTFPQRDLQINAEQILRNLHTIKGLHNYNQEDFINAVEFMEQYHRTFPFESLVYDGFVLKDIEAAFAYAVNEKPFRVGVKI